MLRLIMHNVNAPSTGLQLFIFSTPSGIFLTVEASVDRAFTQIEKYYDTNNVTLVEKHPVALGTHFTITATDVESYYPALKG